MTSFFSFPTLEFHSKIYLEAERDDSTKAQRTTRTIITQHFSWIKTKPILASLSFTILFFFSPYFFHIREKKIKNKDFPEPSSFFLLWIVASNSFAHLCMTFYLENLFWVITSCLQIIKIYFNKSLNAGLPTQDSFARKGGREIWEQYLPIFHLKIIVVTMWKMAWEKDHSDSPLASVREIQCALELRQWQRGWRDRKWSKAVIPQTSVGSWCWDGARECAFLRSSKVTLWWQYRTIPSKTTGLKLFYLRWGLCTSSAY